jgi:protein-L-isoaspartate O-methyltransferase
MVVAQPGNPSPTSGEDAALMAELVGSEGTVTTVDIDRGVTDRARTLLETAGYSRVKVALADAENGVPEHAPFDRIIVTVGACASRRPGWSSSPTTGTSSSRCGHGA